MDMVFKKKVKKKLKLWRLRESEVSEKMLMNVKNELSDSIDASRGCSVENGD